MPILQIAKDGVLLQEIEIRTATMNIGRDPENEVRLADLTVSRRHGRLQQDAGGRYWIEDLQSRNGIKLNEKLLMQPLELTDGDRLQIGVYQLTFWNLKAVMSQRQSHFNPGGEKYLTMAVKPTRAQSADKGQGEAVEIGILVNEANNAIFTLDRERIVLGSESEVDIRVPGPELIRAAIVRRGEHFYVCSETPGPCVSINGRPIMNAALAYNDRLEIGGRKFIFRQI